jgi:serine/threonine-protein kinase
MASATNASDAVPLDLLPLIRRSGVLSERQYEEVKSKVGSGEYPRDAHALAGRLVEERILTEFQSARLLRLKVHGLVVGRYVILDRLGAGARGRVFRAQHRLMGRVVALKLIAPHIASRASSIARFHREMRLIGRLDHPNVVRAYDADQIGQLLYLIMEYVPGRSLEKVLAARGPLPAADVANYMAQAAQGLAHAHDRGIVHRDVKPSNLLLSDIGQVKVLDLGLSALMEADSRATFATAAGFVVGTLHYMSPEQLSGMEVDARSDLFSLGCTMFYLLSGQVPFPGDTVAECIAQRILGGTIPITALRPDLSPRCAAVLDKLLARSPGDRFQTADETAAALSELAEPTADGAAACKIAAPPETAQVLPEGETSVFPTATAVHVAIPAPVPTPAPAPTPKPKPTPPAPSPWSERLSRFMARQHLIWPLIVLIALLIFGAGFALGHLSAILTSAASR